MKTIARFSLITLLSITLLGCYDMVSQPLTGEGGSDAIFSIAGKWIEKDKNNALEILETSEADEFIFSYTEKDNVWKGVVETSYYGENAILNLDMLSLTLNGDKLVLPNEPLFLLLGLKKKGKTLEIIPADMDKFKKRLSKYFYATPLESLKSCVASKDICKNAFAGHYVLAPARTKKFNYEFRRNLTRIFPAKKAVIFELDDNQ